jgi:Protein of unknown function (DUF1822)
MMSDADSIEDIALPIPITQRGRILADQFAREQPTPQKSEQVRLNTLAVWAVNEYLQLMGIATDLGGSDSWNPVLRLCSNAADLMLPQVGQLECRSVTNISSGMKIEPQPDRIGYVLVRLDDPTQADILGFLPSGRSQPLTVEQMQPIEALIDQLAAQRTVPTPVTSLSQWFQNFVDTRWQTLDSLLAPPTLSFRRSISDSDAENIRRAKALPFEIPLILTIAIESLDDRQVGILLKILPDGDLTLPADVVLEVIDESGAVFLEARSGSTDDYLQLTFEGEPGEPFQVRVSHHNDTTLEEFVI